MFYTNFYYHTATLLQSGKVLVVGGMTYPTLYSRSSPETGFLNTAELYDPDTNTWSIASHLAYTRVNHTATLLPSGQVLVGGGNTGEEFNPSLDAVELYDPVTNSWHGAAHMLAPRQDHFAILLPSGKVLVGSGTSSEYSAPLTSTEIYDPVANTWSTGGTMLHSHIRATPILLPNRQVFVVAGDNSDAWTNAEIYNPQTNT